MSLQDKIADMVYPKIALYRSPKISHESYVAFGKNS